MFDAWTLPLAFNWRKHARLLFISVFSCAIAGAASAVWLLSMTSLIAPHVHYQGEPKELTTSYIGVAMIGASFGVFYFAIPIFVIGSLSLSLLNKLLGNSLIRHLVFGCGLSFLLLFGLMFLTTPEGMRYQQAVAFAAVFFIPAGIFGGTILWLFTRNIRAPNLRA